MEANLADILFSSQGLTRIGDTYNSINELMSTMGYRDAFESASAQEAWNNLHEQIWISIAESTDNLYTAASALVAYVNAMCAQDEENADELIELLKGYEFEFNDINSTEYVIPELDVDDRKDGIVDPPNYDEAKKPRNYDD